MHFLADFSQTRVFLVSVKETVKKWGWPIVGLLLFIIAVNVLVREFKQYTFDQILTELEAIPLKRIIFASFVTLISYLALSLYDFLAVKYVKKRLSAGRVIFSSFLGYSISNNIGFPIISGTSMRLRLYSQWGINASTAAKIVAFTNVTFWTGVLFLGGIILVREPLQIPKFGIFQNHSAQFVGYASLIALGVYLVAILIKRAPIKIIQWELPIPTFSMALGQIIVSSLDWILAASVLYILLPHGHHITFLALLEAFILALTAGFVSHVPGGLGVFETIIILLLQDFSSKPALMSSLFAFRLIYFVMPMVISLIALAFYEVIVLQDRIKSPTGKSD